MSYSNYRDIERAIRNLEEFTGNSARGEWDSNGIYTVYSYRTAIALTNIRTGVAFINGRKFSSTTTRLQNIVRRAWDGYKVTNYGN